MFENTIKQLRRINMSKIALNEFKGMKEEAFDLNTEDQLFSKGIDSEGNLLGPYAPLTVTLRSEAGLPTDRVTLRVTGAFHDAWTGDFRRWPVTFTSKDKKTGELIFLFGENIFGLTDTNINKLLDEGLTENIQEASLKAVQLAIKDI